MDVRTLVARIGIEADHKPLENLEHKLESVKGRLEFLAGAEIVKGLFELAERFSGMGEAIESTATSAGLTAEEFQKMAYAASQNAVGQEELGDALSKLNRNLYAARTGSKEAVAAFADVGISEAQIKSFHTSADAMRALQDRIQAIDDPVKRQAATMALLGRSSAKMVKYLVAGSKATDELGESAEAMGAVLSGEQVEALAEVEDALSGMFGLIKKVAAAIGATFAPTVTAMVHDLEGFYRAHRQAFTTNIQSWVDNISYGLGYVVGIVQEGAKILFGFAEEHPLLVKRAGQVALALAGLGLAAGGALRIFAFFQGMLHNIVSVLSLVTGSFSISGKVAGTAFTTALRLVGFLQAGIAGLATRLGLLVVETFPALGNALFAFGTALAATPVGLLAAGLAAATLAGQALWAVFHDGKSFQETWLGQMFGVLLDIPRRVMAVVAFFRGSAGAPSSLIEALSGKNVPTAVAPPMPLTRDGLPGAVAAGEAPAVGAGTVLREGGAGNALVQAQTALANMQGPALIGAPPPPVAAAAGPVTTNNVAVTAPVTITVPSGTPARETAAAVRQGICDHLDKVHRQAMRSTATATVY